MVKSFYFTSIFMIDKEKFAQTRELMGDAFDDFLQLFVSELEKDILEITNTDDTSIIQLKAHSQKSSCGLLGATNLSEIFLNIETLAQNNQNSAELVKQLPELLKQTKNEIDTL